MDATDNTGQAPGPEPAAAPAAGGGTAAPTPVSDHPLGPDAFAILATEHWSLIGARSLLWNEVYSRTTIFLGALSAAIAVLAVRKAGAATTLAVAVGVVAFLAVWTALFLLQRQSLSALRLSKPRFPTPPDESEDSDHE
jgi:hypothetical protein